MIAGFAGELRVTRLGDGTDFASGVGLVRPFGSPAGVVDFGGRSGDGAGDPFAANRGEHLGSSDTCLNATRFCTIE